MTYEVIDNFLDKDSFNYIKNTIEADNFPWFWNNQVTFLDSNCSPYYFTHVLYNNNMVVSSLYNSEIMSSIFQKLEVKAIIRIKINSYTHLNKFIENENHVDYEYEHKGAILYLNTNNGYTILEDGTKIESIENRLLKFEPHKRHKSTHCTDVKRRMNINFNYF
jgi:hypothetical protein